MSKLNRTWMAVVAAALLAGTLAGVVWARPNDRPLAQEATRKVLVAGADFVPTQDDWDYAYSGCLSCTTNNCTFAAPVVFPTLGSVTIERFKFHVYDNSAYGASATLYRHSALGESWLGQVYDSDTGSTPQTFDSGPINKVVWPSQRAEVEIYIAGQDICVYGVTVEYHRN